MNFSGLQLADSPFVDNGWVWVAGCPSCGSSAQRVLGEIPDQYYAFGTERIAFPAAAISVYECRRCGLYYKSPVPGEALLAALYARHAPDKWTVSHDYSRDVRALRLLAGRDSFDLLDVGAADGAWLRACALAGIRGRRSALDVIRYPGAHAQISGELILGALDDPDLRWSHEPYDVVTGFDVIEHLHRPDVAFANLSALVRPGGVLWIETGRTDSFWPRRFGVQRWWYVRLLEHHVFWSRRPLERIAAQHGFSLVQWEHTRHKSWPDAGIGTIGAELLKTGVYCALGSHYMALAHRVGREGNQPWYPFTRDHLRAGFLRR